MFPLRLLSVMVLGFVFLSAPVLAQSPTFSTQAPLSGEIGGQFVAFVPLFNTGTGPASSVQVTSVTFGIATPTSPTLPISVGTLLPGGHNELDLRFASLTVGATYLLTIRGTYQVGANTFGFAVNRFVTVSVPTGSAQTELRRWVVLDAIKAKFALRSRLDPAADNQELLSFVQTFPDFLDSGIDTGSSSVWATFADGQAIVIANDRTTATSAASSGTKIRSLEAIIPGAASSSPALTQHAASVVSSTLGSDPPTEIPQSRAARLLNTYGVGFSGISAVNDLTSWLGANGYSPVTGADASVESLKTVGGDGVFFFDSHGGFHAGEGVYSVWTSTVADPVNDVLLKSDVNPEPPLAPTLFRMLADLEESQAFVEDEWHYSINANFVRTYFRPFGPNSFVYIDACSSDSIGAQDFKQAFLGKGAPLYAGWTFDVDDDFATKTDKLVFERLLGANRFCPEDGAPTCSNGAAQPPVFAQRPFDYPSVSMDLPLHKLGTFSPVEFLNFTPGSGNFGLLAPSIEYVGTNEFANPPQLYIVGSFGSDQGTVTVGGAPLTTIPPWTPNLIIANLPSDLYGDVVVTVNQHNSNVARLTKWEGDFTANTTGIDTLKQTLDFHLAFRSDIRQYRPVIHNPPMEPTTTNTSAMYAIYPGSEALFTCGGTAMTLSPNESDTYKWTGIANLIPENQANGVPTNGFVMIGAFFQSHTQLNITELGLTAEGNQSGFTPCAQDDQYVIFKPPSEGDRTSNLGICYLPPTFVVQLDPNTADIQPNASGVVLPANSCGWPTGFSQGALTWPKISAAAAPDPTSAR